jgi:hypothetical protein
VPATPSPAPREPLAIIEGLGGGFTFEVNPEAEVLFAAEPATAGMVVRSLFRGGTYFGVVGVLDNGAVATPQDVVNTLAGAEDAGNEVGIATRSSVLGAPAVEVLLPDGGKTWSLLVSQYFCVVSGPNEGVADDVAIQLVRQLA